MLGQILNVFRKEWLEISRDRRSMITLLFMAVAFPLYIYFMIDMASKRAESDLEIAVALINADEAPNMVAFLDRQGVEFTEYDTLAAAHETVKSNIVIVELDPDFANIYEQSQTADVSLYVNQKDQKASGNASQLRYLLNIYNDQVKNARLVARGVSPARVEAINIEEYDLTTAGRASNFLAGFILYMFIATAFTGTIAAAADLIAGEKERQTLQPLLVQPVTRPALVLGKWLTLASLGALFTAIAFIFGGFVISKAPLAAAGATFYLDIKTLAYGAVSLAALAMFAASLQVFLAANAKTYREAMTYLPWTALAPFAVTFVPLFTDVEYDGILSFVPIFNQTFVLRELLLEGAAPLAQFAGGIVTTLCVAGVLLLLTMSRFGNEKSLG
ncbi:MAG: ABC transporter permease [Pseudomonadota bacterium]